MSKKVYLFCLCCLCRDSWHRHPSVIVAKFDVKSSKLSSFALQHQQSLFCSRPILAICFPRWQGFLREPLRTLILFLFSFSTASALGLLKFPRNTLEYLKPKRCSWRDALSCLFLPLSSFLWILTYMSQHRFSSTNEVVCPVTSIVQGCLIFRGIPA